MVLALGVLYIVLLMSLLKFVLKSLFPVLLSSQYAIVLQKLLLKIITFDFLEVKVCLQTVI